MEKSGGSGRGKLTKYAEAKGRNAKKQRGDPDVWGGGKKKRLAKGRGQGHLVWAT